MDSRARDKQRTRARISDVATDLFLRRGFDEVTINEVAAAAGVSKVTVFAHFARKEDLLLDRAPEAIELARAAVTGRPGGTDPITALRLLAVDLAARRHPLSGLTEGNGDFLRTVAASPRLLARAAELRAEIEAALVDALAATAVPQPRLLGAMVLAAYWSVVARSARRMMAGDPAKQVVRDHRAALGVAFDALDAAYAAIT